MYELYGAHEKRETRPRLIEVYFETHGRHTRTHYGIYFEVLYIN